MREYCTDTQFVCCRPEMKLVTSWRKSPKKSVDCSARRTAWMSVVEIWAKRRKSLRKKKTVSARRFVCSCLVLFEEDHCWVETSFYWGKSSAQCLTWQECHEERFLVSINPYWWTVFWLSTVKLKHESSNQCGQNCFLYIIVGSMQISESSCGFRSTSPSPEIHRIVPTVVYGVVAQLKMLSKSWNCTCKDLVAFPCLTTAFVLVRHVFAGSIRIIDPARVPWTCDVAVSQNLGWRPHHSACTQVVGFHS